MKKYVWFLFLAAIISGCMEPGTGSRYIPITVDPSDLEPDATHREVFLERRERVLSGLDAGYVILSATDQESYNRYEFRPNNYFFYLTGIDVPGTCAILSHQATVPYMLFLPPRSIRSMIYQGEPATAAEMKELFGPDSILEAPALGQVLQKILSPGSVVYLDRSDRSLRERLQEIAGPEGNVTFRHIGELVDEMRVIKGSYEIQRLQKACNITAKALANAMKECAPGKYEFEMEAVIEGTFRQYGAAMPGFASIVGSGPNSTILHYEKNTRQMEKGDLLLMDIGAEYGYYTADITRTIPVDGKFTGPQRTIYQLVLDAQKAAIEQMKPGNMFIDGHMAATDVLVDGLSGLGLITDRGSPWQVRFYILYPASHYLGMDVHDVGEMGGSFAYFLQHTTDDSVTSRVLEPGMVLTIEPGLYFREGGLEQLQEIFGGEADSTELAAFAEQVGPVYEQYAGIGVRIEDDILITATGNLTLSRYAPREVSDIQQLMNR
jgi:Xaa-Pro aminopeptidase